VFSSRRANTRKVSAICLSFLLASSLSFARGSPSKGTAAFVFDGNRTYVELSFVRQDRSVHKALAFVDMGGPSMILTDSLFNELQIDHNRSLLFRLGDLTLEVPGAEVIKESVEPYSIGSELKVEGTLSASILQRYQVVIDYQKRNLTFAQPRTLKPRGIPVRFHINQKTGLLSVDASIGGETYPMTIDNGSAYTWFRQSAAKSWLVSHPDWDRGVGAVGASNMMMSGDDAESSGILLRIPQISLGSLILNDVGALAPGSVRSFPGNLDLFDWYSQKNASAVVGWIGGNVLKRFKLTIDYPNHLMYWLQQTNPDSADFNQVGLTLRFEHGEYFVAAVARKKGRPTVEGVLPGDRLIRVGDLETRNATWGAIYDRMHGKPDETRTLLLERDGNRLNVIAKVTAF